MKKICVITGTRAEYGLLKPLLQRMKASKKIDLKLIVCGMHLSKEFGKTVNYIKNDKFKIDGKVDNLIFSDSTLGTSQSMALAQVKFTKQFQKIKPDSILVLGDRYEILAAATAAMISNIPIIHIHGGERTEGAIDEQIRHAITKMSHLHFTSIEEYKKRVIQLGENPKRVFCVGALGIEAIKTIELLSKKKLQSQLGILTHDRNILITYHPDTLSNKSSQNFKELLKAVSSLENCQLIFTKANADTDGTKINQLIDNFANKNKKRSKVFTSMGQVNYLSALSKVDLVIGNSSSGILEAPSFNIPSINIGDRQKGRATDKSVIHCSNNSDEILKHIKNVFSKKITKNKMQKKSIYDKGLSSKKIISVLEKTDFSKMLNKSFFDIKYKI